MLAVEEEDGEAVTEQPVMELSEARLKHHERQTSRDITLPGSDAPSGEPEEGPVDQVEASQDRTGAWLSGLDVTLAPQTPANGHIYQLSDDMPIPPELTETPLDPSKSQILPGAIPEEDGGESISTVSPALERLTDAGSDLLSSMELFGLDFKTKDSEKETDRLKEIEHQTLSEESPLPSVKPVMDATSPLPSKALNLERRWKRVTHHSDENEDRQSPRPSMPPKMPPPPPERPTSPLSRYIHSTICQLMCLGL